MLTLHDSLDLLYLLAYLLYLLTYPFGNDFSDVLDPLEKRETVDRQPSTVHRDPELSDGERRTADGGRRTADGDRRSPRVARDLGNSAHLTLLYYLLHLASACT